MSSHRYSVLALTAILALIGILGLNGCSQVRLAYGSADFLIASYADGYLGLKGTQRDRWKPQLRRVLDEHRREELPHLAAFFDRALQVSRAGFPAPDTTCLVATFRDIYQRHARLAVELAVPLLADLEPSQVGALKARFARELAEDGPKSAGKEREQRKRAKRYVTAIEEWTGALAPEQRSLVSDLTRRMPDTREAVIDYRTRKRAELIGLIESGAGAERLRDFLTTWLVDYRDLPPDLRRSSGLLEERLVELVGALASTLTAEQSSYLERRLSGLRTDLLKLQLKPRLSPARC